MNDFTKEELTSNKLTKDDIGKAAQLFTVIAHNFEQEQLFKSGGIALPKVKNYEEYLKLTEIIKKYLPLASESITFENIQGKEITYDIPERFKNNISIKIESMIDNYCEHKDEMV